MRRQAKVLLADPAKVAAEADAIRTPSRDARPRLWCCGSSDRSGKPKPR
jgi:hypothetical protein